MGTVESAQVILKKTLSSLEAQRARTEKEIKAVRLALSAIGTAPPKAAGRRLRKPMTAAERRSVSKRMRAYWAKKRAQKA
jgi:hypothetical protein